MIGHSAVDALKSHDVLPHAATQISKFCDRNCVARKEGGASRRVTGHRATLLADTARIT